MPDGFAGSGPVRLPACSRAEGTGHADFPLRRASRRGWNLLLASDFSLPSTAPEPRSNPMQTVGQWLAIHRDHGVKEFRPRSASVGPKVAMATAVKRPQHCVTP